MKVAPPPASDFPASRHLEVFDDPIYDPYQTQENLFESSACSECGAVYLDGRWQWIVPPVHALHTRCPACRRMDEKAPAAYVSLEGQFVHDHREELMAFVRALEAHQKAENPLQRIMAIDEHGDKLMITTTDIHLARAIGEALQQAYQGHLDFNYTDAEYLLRVSWRR
jgi:NMD protein affecting ribosome stability and mRNA decay